MANYNSGIVNVDTPGAVIDSTIPSRRLFNFSDRVADLSPDESPFFVYLSKVAKVPTDDPQFRFLEDRTKISMTDRSFLLVGTHSIPAAGSSLTYSVDASGASVDWLQKGMVFAVEYAENNAPETLIVRVESAVTDAGATSSFTGRTISSVDGAETGADNAKCTVIGSSFAEGSGAPDVFSEELDNGFGRTQIFKTACEMSNTARATRYRGYADEWQRIWNLKLREHKIDIERAMMIDTIHGSLALVKEPLFRGFASGFCMMVDLDNVAYRPLVGNGVNRDTHIISNVQSDDEDLRKDMILTEAGLEVSLPETHYLLNLEGV